jgi:hypothetical protein
MARPRRGRLPKDQLTAAGRYKTAWIPAGDFSGNNTGPAGWQPRSTTEAIRCFWYDPNLDVGSAVNVYVVWSTSSSTTTDTATWTVLYTPLTFDTDAFAAPATTLDTAIAADAAGTASTPRKTAAGVLNAANITDGDALHLQVTCSATSGLTLNPAAASNDKVTFHGLILEYTTTNLD